MTRNKNRLFGRHFETGQHFQNKNKNKQKSKQNEQKHKNKHKNNHKQTKQTN